jgi:hypothetical protein
MGLNSKNLQQVDEKVEGGFIAVSVEVLLLKSGLLVFELWLIAPTVGKKVEFF